MAPFSKINFVAIMIASSILITQAIIVYLVMGDAFWSFIFLIIGCFLIIPYFGIRGLAQAGAPVSLSRFLADLLNLSKNGKSHIAEDENDKDSLDKGPDPSVNSSIMRWRTFGGFLMGVLMLFFLISWTPEIEYAFFAVLFVMVFVLIVIWKKER